MNLGKILSKKLWLRRSYGREKINDNFNDNLHNEMNAKNEKVI